VGSRGCTLSCDYCRNWSISQQLNVPRKALSPSELIKIAQEKGVQGICFTYNEPFLWYEYLKECLPLCRQAGFATLIKTGGYIELEPVKALLPWISAVNLDIKGFSEAFYQKICKGSLAPVLALALLLKKEVPLELSYLLVPGENEKELFPFAKWVQENLGSWTPLHLGAFFPAHRLKDRVQSRESEVCEAFLRLKADFPFVYASSFFTKSASENSFCPSCGVLLVERNKQEVRSFLKEPLCFSCKKELPFSLSFSASSNEIETYVSKAY
jgi:pyruvate formate lyase activating enzyme